MRMDGVCQSFYLMAVNGCFFIHLFCDERIFYGFNVFAGLFLLFIQIPDSAIHRYFSFRFPKPADLVDEEESCR